MLSSGFIKENIKRFHANIDRHIGRNRILLHIGAWLDEMLSFVVFGASPDDYFRYQFYRKNWTERRKFVVWRTGKKLVKKYNSKNAFAVFNDKRLMNKALGDYIGRRWLDLSTATEKEFEHFSASVGDIIMKPYDGAGGHGIFILRQAEKQRICISDYGKYIAEEVLIQHPDLAELNASSVNTIRVLTFCGEIISCVLKVGRGGAVVDNMSSNGMYGNINIEYGLTDSAFYDIDLNEYLYHPTSGMRLIGVEIPRWNELKALVRKAAQVFPDVRYIGWDCAVLRDKVVIVEANELPGHDLSCQSTKQEGIYEKIREIERKNKRNKVQ